MCNLYLLPEQFNCPHLKVIPFMRKFLLLFLLVSFPSFAQQLEGTVLDAETQEPLQGVHIFSEGQMLAISGAGGRFVIRREEISREGLISFSILGYRKTEISLSELQAQPLIVKLSPQPDQLEEVFVGHQKQLKQKLGLEKLASLEMGVYAAGSALVDNKIYVVGGNRSYLEDPLLKEMLLNPQTELEDLIQASTKNFSWQSYYHGIQVYDLERDQWSTSERKLEKRANHSLNFVDGKLYVIGGTTLSGNRDNEYLQNKIEILDPEKDSLIIDKVNPHQAYGSASFTHQGNIIVMGGSLELKNNGKKAYSSQVHLFNPGTGFWYEMKEMPTPKETQGVLVSNSIYLVGGYNGKALSEIESFNLLTGEWTPEASLPEISAHPAVTAHQELLYIQDGNRIYTYHLPTKELREYRVDLDLHGARMHYANGKLFIIGGYSETEYLRKAESACYSIDLEEFKTTRAVSTFL